MSTTDAQSTPPSAPCCGPDCCNDGTAARAAEVTTAVREKYGQTARSGLSTDHAGVRAVAEAFGYSESELTSIPAEANMGLSCGNPIALANLKPGETVVDLGSGGGLDVFLAAQKVGPAGKAIGIDMTPEMIDLARRNAHRGVNGQPFTNVEFHLATIDKLPLPDASADVVISNCVINLAPDKPAVFREIHRVLKPGGRLAVSDIALKRPLPPELANDLMAYVGCISGAIEIDDYRRALTEAGFAHVHVVDSGADLNAYAKVENQSACCSPAASSGGLPITSPSCCGQPHQDPASCCGQPPEDAALHQRLAELLKQYDVNDYAASVKVYAVRNQA